MQLKEDGISISLHPQKGFMETIGPEVLSDPEQTLLSMNNFVSTQGLWNYLPLQINLAELTNNTFHLIFMIQCKARFKKFFFSKHSKITLLSRAIRFYILRPGR
jgi:hypothetical protein